MQRNSGYYWVRYKDQPQWNIANWNGASWSIFGSLITVPDDYFSEISRYGLSIAPTPESSHPEKIEQTGWISVSERMPERGGEYFVYGKIRSNWKRWTTNFNGKVFHVTQRRRVTHWMPIPFVPLPALPLTPNAEPKEPLKFGEIAGEPFYISEPKGEQTHYPCLFPKCNCIETVGRCEQIGNTSTPPVST